MELLATIRKLYAQQKEMFDEKKRRVAERIVGVTQPYVRPIVRGKVKAPVEFGAKYDVSVALSVLVANLFGVQLPCLFLWLFGEMWHDLWRHEVRVASQGGMTRLLFRSAA